MCVCFQLITSKSTCIFIGCVDFDYSDNITLKALMVLIAKWTPNSRRLLILRTVSVQSWCRKWELASLIWGSELFVVDKTLFSQLQFHVKFNQNIFQIPCLRFQIVSDSDSKNSSGNFCITIGVKKQPYISQKRFPYLLIHEHEIPLCRTSFGVS